MAPEANARVLSGFLDYLRIEKGLAANSISAYTTDILQFAEFLEKHKRLLFTARRNDVRNSCSSFFRIRSTGAVWGESFLRCVIYIVICCLIRESITIRR